MFRTLFAEAQEAMGWAGGGPGHRTLYVPHSLRHGGASCDFLVWGGERLEEILFRGRWASMASTRHYVQTGPALMAAGARAVPGWQRELGHCMAAAIRLWIAVPSEL